MEQAPHVLVIGAGSLGCALLPRALRLPFGSLTIMDGDTVEAHNLERQDLYAHVDIGRPKAAVAAAWMRNAPHGIHINADERFIGVNNADEVIAMHDLVFDLTDDAHVRRLIDRTCEAFDVPLISGAVHGAQGQLMVLHAPGTNASIGLDDLFTGKPGPNEDACDMRNVPPTVLNAVARRLCDRARDLLTSTDVINGRIEIYEGDTDRWSTLDPPIE